MGYISSLALLCVVVYANAKLSNFIEGPRFLNSSIVVIGDGISAIHITKLLKQKGYTDITILVEGNRLGGDDVISRTHRGTVHEMGRHMYVPAAFSDEIDQFMAGLGRGAMKEVNFPTIWELNDALKLKAKTPDEYFKGNFGDFGNFKNLNDNAIKSKYVDMIKQFEDYVTSLVGQRDVMFDEPSWQNKFKLGGSLQDFLTSQGLQGLIPFFSFLFGTQGYGRLESIPTYYGIFYFKPRFLQRLRERIQNNVGLRGIPAFKLYSDGLESLFDAAVQREQLTVRKNARVDNIELRAAQDSKHRLSVNENGVQKSIMCDFVVFADDLKKYIALNRRRSQKEYQQFLRPSTKYVIKTLVDSLNIERGSSPVEFFADPFNPGAPFEYKMASSVDSYGAKYDRSGDAYRQNLFSNTDDPNDQRRNFKSAVYTQLTTTEPNVATANSRLLAELSALGGTNMTVVETKVHKIFPCYTDRDLINGMLYDIFNMQGKNGVLYTGKSVFLDSLNHMLIYNKMLVNKLKMMG